MLRQEIAKLLHQFISSTFITLQALQQQLVDLTCVRLANLPSLSKLYNIVSSGENKTPTEALDVRLKRITQQLRDLEIQSFLYSSSFGDFGVKVLPLYSVFVVN